MVATARNVEVGATGKIYSGVAGTAMPTTASASLNAGFKDLGYISEDGVTQSIGADSNEIKAWGGTTVRVIQTSHTVTFHWTMIETNPDVLAAYYGSANFDDVLNRVLIKSGGNTRGEWVIDVVDGTDKIRIVIPDGEVTEKGDVVYKTDEAIGYEVTITAYPDTSDVKAYEYLLVNAVS